MMGGGVASGGGSSPSALYTSATAVWDFENNGDDTKGAYDLTAVNTPTYSTTGEAQGVYWSVLNGTNQHYSHAGNSAFAFTGDYSVSFWVNSDSYEWQGGFLSYYDSLNAGNGWGVQIAPDGGDNLTVVHSTGYTRTTATFPTTFSTGTRYHIVLIYSDSGNTVTAYISSSSFGDIMNGTTVAMTANPGDASTNGTLYIGRSAFDEVYHDGYLDEVALWNSAITSINAEAIFNARDGGISWR